MKQLKTVFNFEFMNYAKRKSFIALTLGLIIIVTAVLSWPRVGSLIGSGSTGNDGEKAKIVALIDETGGKAGDAEYYNISMQNTGYSFIASDLSRDEADKRVESGEYDTAIIVTGPLEYIRIARNIAMNDSLKYIFEEALLRQFRQQSLLGYGMPSGEIDSFLNAAVLGKVQMTASGKDQMQNFFYTYILIFLLYFAIIIYGQLVASSVATEKSTRAMELLITSTNPRSLMFGKVLGASLAGFTQLLLILGAAYLFYNINASYYENSAIVRSIFAMPLSMLLYTLLFFVLGFLLYAFLYASLASLVSRMEELSTVVMPVTFLFVIAFMIVMLSMAGGNVDSPLMIACSFIPFTSPMAMFTRIAMGEVPAWQIVLSVAILAGSTIGVGVVAASIYRLGVLLYGIPPKPKEIVRMLRVSKTN